MPLLKISERYAPAFRQRTKAVKLIKVKTEQLKKNFGSLEVLKGIDLEVKEGEVVCLIAYVSKLRKFRDTIIILCFISSIQPIAERIEVSFSVMMN